LLAVFTAFAIISRKTCENTMKPKCKAHTPQRELFQTELDLLVRKDHPLVLLGRRMDWASFEEQLGGTYHARLGAPGVSTRLMVGLHYLKYQHDLSDEAVLSEWVENPYWQHFCGEQFFQHKQPVDSSSLTRWRKRLGEAGAELLLKQTLLTALATGALPRRHLAQVNVDTTVQTKAVRHPTDARLLHRARERLVKEARAAGMRIRQSYERVGKRLLYAQSRYAHARQMKRAQGCVKKLRTQLGRVIREVQAQARQKGLSGKLSALLEVAQRVHAQERQSKEKVYSLHEPHIGCIAKGKAHKKYEFGSKASLATTQKSNWILGALNLPGNPYDGHTLGVQLAQIKRLSGAEVKHVYVDQGYRGHGHEGAQTIHVDKRRRAETPRALWKRMKRRSAIEPVIGHEKSDHRLERNRLKGERGDALNALLSAAAYNFKKLLRFLLRLFLRFWFGAPLRGSNALSPQPA